MRNLALSLAAAVTLFVAPASTLAVEFDVGPGGVRVEPHRYNHGYYRHGYGRYGSRRRGRRLWAVTPPSALGRRRASAPVPNNTLR